MENSPPLSPWQYKPWWCQPWSIALTGCGTIGASWLVFHRYWLTGLVAVPLSAWMIFFLLIWPKLMVESGMLEAMHPPEDQPHE
jgi:hypothetical protein